MTVPGFDPAAAPSASCGARLRGCDGRELSATPAHLNGLLGGPYSDFSGLFF